jgi:hypothetical protein
MDLFPTAPRQLLLIILLMSSLSLPAQTIFQDAMHLNTLRETYTEYAQAISKQNNLFYPSPDSALNKRKPPLKSEAIDPLRAEIKAILNIQDPATSNANTTKSSFGDSPNPNVPLASGGTSTTSGTTTVLTPAVVETQIQKVAQEWALIERYIVITRDSLHLHSRALDSLAPMGDGFTYLDDITTRVAGQGSNTAAATSGTFSSLLGMNEAEIIMGIVDWTLKQAKEELVKAFLGEWMDRIENDSALTLLFPNTLNMLRTTDITTIFSNGDVWKAAFKQDLDAAPDKIPQIISLLLRHLPPNALTPNEEKEIQGAARIARDIYQSIGKGNTLDDVLVTLCNKSMLVPENQLSVLEKAVILSDALLEGITIIKNQKVSFVTPSAIASLDSTQLLDLWNLIFITLEPKFDKVFAGTEVDSVYHRVAQHLPLFQYSLMQLADIIQTIKQLTDQAVPGSVATTAKTLTLQETDRYFQLSLDLLDQSVDLLDSLHILSAKDADFYRDKARPIAVDVMNGVEAVATQQYGLLITSVIDIVEKLNLQGGNLAAALAEAASLIDKLKRDAKSLSTSSDVNGDLNALAISLVNYRTAHGAALMTNPASSGFKNLLDVTIAKLLQNNVGTLGSQDAVQKFVDGLLEDLEKEVETLLKNLEGELASTELGLYINTYGRFIVNLLSAQNSEDIETLLDDFAGGTGGYMVKQTSKSAFTVTFLPGIDGGAELLEVPTASGGTEYSIGAYGGATLPIGIEYSLGISNCKVFGAVGFYGQVADLGALLKFRLTNTDTLPVTPQIGFQQVISPGFWILGHATKVPIVLGAGLSYSPALRAIGPDNAPTYEAPSLRLGASLTVDVTVFQLWASKKKINPNYQSMGQVDAD